MTRRVRVRVRMWTFVAMFSQGFFLYIAVQDLSDWTWGSMAWCWSSVRISRLWNYQHHPCQHHNHCHHHIHHWHTKLFTVIDSNLSIDLDDFPVLLVAVVLSGVATTFYTMRQVFFNMIWFSEGNFWMTSLGKICGNHITTVKPGIYGLAFTMGKWLLTDNSATVGRIHTSYLSQAPQAVPV